MARTRREKKSSDRGVAGTGDSRAATDPRFFIPKRRTRVTVRTTRGREEKVLIFLGEAAEEHSGPERPDDVFNAPAEFLAVEDDAGEIAIVRPANVALVVLEAPDAQEVVRCGDLVAHDGVSERVFVEMDDGSQFTGILRFQLPEGRRRLGDYLNSGPLFLPLQCDDGVVLVNKRCIACVRPG